MRGATKMSKEGTMITKIRKNWLFYASILPFFVVFLMFVAHPIIASFFLGFTKWDGVSSPKFVGLDNYTNIFNDSVFIKSIYNTVYIWFFQTFITLTFAFILAFLVNHYITKAKNFYRTVFLFPMLIAPALTSIIISVLFSSNSGVINAILSFFTGERVVFGWLDSEFWIKPIIILLIVWRWTGYHFIIFLAGMQTIPNSLYDAAKIDGANGFQIVRHITVPLMVPIILFSFVIATNGGIQLFDEPYVLTNGSGGTLQSGMTMGMYLYSTAFNQFQFGKAAAVSYVIFAIILVLTLVTSKFIRNKN